MALSKCCECGGKISDQALLCPHCGFGLERALDKLQRRRVSPSPAGAAAAASFEEKRRFRRMEIRTMVRVEGEKALLFNISRAGMMLSTPFQPKGPLVEVLLEINGQTFELKGRIRWVSGKRSFSNLIDFGVEITDAPPGYNELIDRIESD